MTLLCVGAKKVISLSVQNVCIVSIGVVAEYTST